MYSLPFYIVSMCQLLFLVNLLLTSLKIHDGHHTNSPKCYFSSPFSQRCIFCALNCVFMFINVPDINTGITIPELIKYVKWLPLINIHFISNTLTSEAHIYPFYILSTCQLKLNTSDFHVFPSNSLSNLKISKWLLHTCIQHLYASIL